MKNDKIVVSAILFAVLATTLAVMLSASAYDHDQTYNANSTYFVPEDIRASGYCDTKNVAIWINTSVPVNNGRIEFDYTYCCANVTSVTRNPIWTQGDVNLQTPGKVIISFGSTTSYSGQTKIADMTIHCCNTSSCCGTWLAFNTDPTYSYLFYAGGKIPTVNWANGTFLCGNPIEITKTVWDESTSSWVDALGPLPSEWKGKDVVFNITIESKCLDLSNVVVSDVMDPSLEYNDNASPVQTSNTTNTATWNLGSLAAGNSQTITFNATIVDYGTGYNTATVNATVTDLGVNVQAQDDASVTVMPPARIEVNKTVWNPVGGAWVEGIDNARIGDTYTMRCEVHNGGSPGMDLTNVEVWDVISPSLAYADSARLQTPDGIWRSIEPPTSTTTGPNGETIVNWTINGYLQSALTLYPCQTLVIEYNTTVVNYGNDTNTQYAKGWCDAVNTWIVGNDTAYINTPPPDMTVRDITINYDASSVKNKAIGPLSPGTKTQCNNLSANISEFNGVAVVFPFKVTFEVNGAELNCSPVQVPAGMAGGSTKTVYCNCSFYPIANQTYNISVIADSTNAIIESNEANNTAWSNVTAQWIGFKGDGWQDGRNITKFQCHEQDTINITYSAGDSKYLSGSANPNWTTYTVNWTTSDLPIPPVDTCIKKARLYVYYTWDLTPGRNISDYFTMKFNGYEVLKGPVYTDARFAGDSYNWGMVAYNVTDKFVATSANKAVLTNSYPGGDKVSMEGMFLVVVYNNPNEPERIIMMNEGLDTLYANGDYGISTEEATTYAPFTCSEIPLNKIGKAMLSTVTVDASSGLPNMQALYFNGNLLGKGEIWPVKTSIPTVNETDVLPYLKATDNIAALQSYKPDGYTKGDSFEASLAFLILEKGKAKVEVVDPPECVGVGEQFNVPINVTPKNTAVYGVEYEISFDPTVIHAEWQNEGNFLKQGGVSTNVYKNVIDNTNGKLSFAVTRIDTSTGATTPGTLAIIHFTALKQGANTTLNLTRVKATDPEAHTIYVETVNSTVYVCDNNPPTAKGKSLFKFNNVGAKYLSKAFFNGSASFDPDGNITYYRWWFGDGNDGVGKITEHVYRSFKWNGNSYDPFEVTLTVQDDGTPILENTTTPFPVDVFIAGDTNGDGEVDIIDGTIVGLEFWKACSSDNWGTEDRKDMADLNNDCEVDIIDATIVGVTFWHTAW